MRLALNVSPNIHILRAARLHMLFLAVSILLFILAGCAPAVQVTTTPEAEPPTQAPATIAPTSAPTGTSAPGSTSAPTATPDTRLKPEQWQEWPAVPERVSAHLAEIYRQGQSLGNDPTHFSKLGDCQSIREALLGMFEKGKPYNLPAGEEALLKATIEQFAGSFNRDGQAVQGGFNAASVLSPLWANPDVCRPGETPLDCELRSYKPSFLIVSLEIAWPGRTIETYEKYMRQIIERALEKGVVPILVTKADNVEGDDSINLATARLAYEYDLPLVNWWLDAQSMPNRGFDPARDDGFHISMEAWTERSLQVLKTLALTWKAAASADAVEAAPQATATIQASPQPPADLQVLTLPTSQAAAPGVAQSTGQVYFGLAKRVEETELPLGVYRLDPATGVKTELFGEGYNLQAVSPDGARMLVNKGGELYLAGIDAAGPVLLTSSFYANGRQGAAWSPDGKALVFIAAQAGGNVLVYYPLDGGGWQKLTTANDNPVELYRPASNGYIFLDANGQAKRLTAPGLPGEMLDGKIKPAASPDGAYLAYTVARAGDKTGLVIAAADGSRETTMENIGDHIIDYAWSEDGKALSILTLVQSDYSGQWYDLRNMVVTPADMGTRILPAVSGLNARAVWAPDGSGLLFASTVGVDGQYEVRIGRYEFSGGAMTDLTEAAELKGEDFLLVTNIFRR
jgi:hypothetical protein